MAKILVIDDDSAVRRMVSRILSKASHDVIEAENGIEGIQKYRAEDPDIVVMDIVMPHQDGIQTIQEIRDVGLKTGVIAISGGGVGAGALYLSIAKELGADAIVQKPFRPDDLVATVERVLNRNG
jgi:DNA-binding response OmpR family regulator